MAYAFTKGIVIDPSKLGASDLTDYPIGIIGTYVGTGNDPDLRQTASGGDVTSLSGYDIVFSSDSANASPLDFEIESYSPTTGAVVFWVRVPSVSHTINTAIFIHYGDATVTTFQGDINGTWNSKWKGVWHLAGDTSGPLGQPITATGLSDSTVSARNCTDASNIPPARTVAGISDGALSSDEGRLSFPDTGLPSGLQPFSMSVWAKWPASFGGGGLLTIGTFPTNNRYVRLIAMSSGTLLVLDDNVSGFSYTVPGGLQFNTQYYIVGTFDGVNAQLYLNGVLVKGPSAVGFNTILTGTGYIQGQNPAVNNFQSDAIIDEVRIADVVLGSSEILAHYNNVSSPSTFYSFGGTPFTASCGSPPDGTVGELYTHTFPTPTDGGVPPYHWALLTRDDESFTPEDVLNNITLNGNTAVWSGWPANPGTYQFTLDVFDVVSFEAKVDCEITIADSAPVTPPEWIPAPPVDTPSPGAGWDFSGACAHTGSRGLRHIADGSDLVANSKTSALAPITVEAEQVLYVAFWLKSSGGADGTIGFGFMFYSEDNVYLSEEYVTSDSFPTSWTQFNGVITVPTNAVKAIPTIQTIEHRTGVWCIDDAYAIISGGNFILSSVKSYFTEWINAR